MKKRDFKKIGIALLVLVMLFVCGFAAELLWFNRQVLALPQEQQTIRDVSFYDLELEDMEFGEDGWFMREFAQQLRTRTK